MRCRTSCAKAFIDAVLDEKNDLAHVFFE